MTDLNTTVENMSKEDLAGEYVSLKNQNQTLLKKIDDYEQQLYETKRQLTTSKLMEQELSAELEAMQGSSETEQYKRKISHLEEEIASLKQANSDNIEQLETEISEKDSEIESLRNKINDLSIVTVDKSKEEIIDKLNDEVYELKSNNELLIQELDEHQMKIKDLTKENTKLENKIMEISKEVEEVKEYLAIKREELEAVNERFTNVQDELAVTQMELDRCKNVPLDQNKKGNSLFAEVEDNRKVLKKHLQQMNKKYSEMKVSYSRKTMELQKIHAAYVSLKSQVEENTLHNDQSQNIIKAYEDVIENLKKNFAALQQELVLRKQATDKILNGQQKSNEALIEISRKEILELRAELNQQHHLRLFSEKSLYDTNAELKRWRQEAKILELENNLLKQKIDDLEFKLTSAEIQPETKGTNTSEKTRTNNLQNENKNDNNSKISNTNEKQEAGTSDTQMKFKFNPEKYKIKPLSQQEINLFCKERTLTVIEKDLLSPGPNDSIKNYNIPDLSSSYSCDFSFEAFDDEISLSAPIPEPTPSDIKNESQPVTTSTKVIPKTTVSEGNINKENVNSSNLNVENKKIELPSITKTKETGKIKRKVCFSDDSETEDKPKPKNTLRGGKILVPKRKLTLFSNAAKKV